MVRFFAHTLKFLTGSVKQLAGQQDVLVDCVDVLIGGADHDLTDERIFSNNSSFFRHLCFCRYFQNLILNFG